MKFECWNCKFIMETDISNEKCIHCGSEWIEPVYDYEEILKRADRIFNNEITNLWKYIDFLPILSKDNIITLEEGGTPLIRARNLSKKYNIELYIKDEGLQPPTYTFKNRGGTLAVSGLKQNRHNRVALYSTGNIGVAFSYYCKKGGIEVFIFCPKDIAPDKIEEMENNGAKVTVVDGTYVDAMSECRAFAKNNNIYMDSGAKSIYRRASKKTIAFEIFEQLNRKAPGWYFQSVSGGLGPLGIYTAFNELKQMGMIKRIPAIGCVQVDGCNPMYQSFIKNTETITTIESPTTNITTLATGKPMSYPYVFKAVKSSGGIIESVPEEECYKTNELLFKEEGIVSSPASVAALAGIIKLSKSDFLKDQGSIVFVSTGRK